MAPGATSPVPRIQAYIHPTESANGTSPHPADISSAWTSSISRLCVPTTASPFVMCIPLARCSASIAGTNCRLPTMDSSCPSSSIQMGILRMVKLDSTGSIRWYLVSRLVSQPYKGREIHETTLRSETRWRLWLKRGTKGKAAYHAYIRDISEKGR